MILKNFATVNVEAQQLRTDDVADGNGDGDDLSVLQFWQRALANRKEHADVFVYSYLEELTVEHPQVSRVRSY